jgi:hypothetical protein
MKTAIVKSKNEFGQLLVEGEAVLLNKMDTRQGESFYELRFIGSDATNCRWVDNSAIKGDEVNERN